jgi:hypothetical protein
MRDEVDDDAHDGKANQHELQKAYVFRVGRHNGEYHTRFPRGKSARIKNSRRGATAGAGAENRAESGGRGAGPLYWRQHNGLRAEKLVCRFDAVFVVHAFKLRVEDHQEDGEKE